MSSNSVCNQTYMIYNLDSRFAVVQNQSETIILLLIRLTVCKFYLYIFFQIILTATVVLLILGFALKLQLVPLAPIVKTSLGT